MSNQCRDAEGVAALYEELYQWGIDLVFLKERLDLCGHVKDGVKAG